VNKPVKYYNVWIVDKDNAAWLDASGRMNIDRTKASRYKSAKRATSAGERWIDKGYPRWYEVLSDNEYPSVGGGGIALMDHG